MSGGAHVREKRGARRGGWAKEEEEQAARRREGAITSMMSETSGVIIDMGRSSALRFSGSSERPA